MGIFREDEYKDLLFKTKHASKAPFLLQKGLTSLAKFFRGEEVKFDEVGFCIQCLAKKLLKSQVRVDIKLNNILLSGDRGFYAFHLRNGIQRRFGIKLNGELVDLSLQEISKLVRERIDEERRNSKGNQ